MCSFDDKRYLLEDGITSLAFGHHSIPAQVQNIEDLTCDTVVLTGDEARKKNMRVRRRPPPEDPTLTVGKRPKSIWKVRNDKQNEKVKEYLCARLGIVREEEEEGALVFADDDDDEVALEDEDDSIALDEEDCHPNPFIL